MLLLHPGFRTCDDCEKFIYDPQTGEAKYFPPNSGVQLPRPKGIMPPCYCCPKVANEAKKNPEQGRQAELSDKNYQTLHLYQCLHGARVDGSGLDDIAVSNLGIVHRLLTDHQRQRTP